MTGVFSIAAHAIIQAFVNQVNAILDLIADRSARSSTGMTDHVIS
jgi:hypothetical protein